jgi:hypothetical protein
MLARTLTLIREKQWLAAFLHCCASSVPSKEIGVECVVEGRKTLGPVIQFGPKGRVYI